MKNHLEVGYKPLEVISTQYECVVAEVTDIIPDGKDYARLFAAAPELRKELENSLEMHIQLSQWMVDRVPNSDPPEVFQKHVARVKELLLRTKM